MSDLFAARSQMAISLGFHIVFAAIGMTMPFFMALAHLKWLYTKDPTYLKITQAWSKGVAILFATGAVSGTVLSFELGLLWPGFMEHAGAIIGMPFSWEGAAFFLEAIAIGIYLYGWNRLSPWLHWVSGIIVGVSGIASGFFVICANGWMNAPTGFVWENGQASQIDPWAAMFNPAAFSQGLHMIFASFAATGFAVAGIHAWGVLKNPKSAFHQRAMRIALGFGAIFALLQPIQGDGLAKQVARLQPSKFAAMEALFQTQKPAPLLIGGFPDQEKETVQFGIHLPRLLSFLAHGDFESEVKGLDTISKTEWPPVAVTHIAFEIMIAIGMLMAGISTLAIWALWAPWGKIRPRNWLYHPRFLWALVVSIPLGFIAIEAGWTVTEVGRQPWIIYGIMKTKDAVTPMPGLIYPLAITTGVYFFLSFLVAWLLMRQFKNVE